jgi:hypothetical protein
VVELADVVHYVGELREQLRQFSDTELVDHSLNCDNHRDHRGKKMGTIASNFALQRKRSSQTRERSIIASARLQMSNTQRGKPPCLVAENV